MNCNDNVLLQNIFEQPLELRKVLEDLSGPKLETVLHISNLMRISDEIVLTSMGSAFYSLMPMYEALCELSTHRVRLVETASLIQQPNRLNKNALYIIMSRSGESREVADFSQYLKENNFISVGVTMTPDSTVGRNCSYMLHDISSYDKIVCIKAYSSMCLCGLFLVSMMNRTEPDAELLEKLYSAFDWMENNKVNIHEQIRKIPFMNKANNFYLLSRGYGINMMRSCSLWMEETSKIPANVMSIDNFFHGSMEIIRSHSIVKSVTVPVLLDILPDSRSKMIWDSVNKFVPETIYFGPEGSGASGGVSILYPDLGLSTGYTNLLLAMYFQLLSYQCALDNGIEPGMFFDDGWIVK